MKLPSLYSALVVLPLLASAAHAKKPVSAASLTNYDAASVKKYVGNKFAPKPFGATPTTQQVAWQRLEYYGFIHFGLNTFTGREWGYGDEKPGIFNPTEFDAHKALSTMKAGGMKGMIYTAKHHDGWCAWPTKSTKHNISASPYKNGKGDIVKEFSKAAADTGILFGTYLSPWDRNHAEYGREGYLKAYYQQITELLTNYGPVFEIWFDGANGGDGYYGGARERRNIGAAEKYYNFQHIVKLIRKLQPDCIIWGAGTYGDARWGGSEKGHVGYPHWHTLTAKNPNAHAQGATNGERWVPAEGDTPINHAGWFWHRGQAGRVKSPEHLMQVWFDSVGRGANLLVNVALDNKGQFDAADVKSLLAFRKLRDELYKKDYALGATVTNQSQIRMDNKELFGAALLFDDNIESYWSTNDGVKTGTIEAKLVEPAIVDVVRIREQIRLGQRVQAWAFDIKVDGQWIEATSGQSIGNQILFRFDNDRPVTDIRLRITAAKACPTISEISLFKMPYMAETGHGGYKNPGISKKGWKVVAQPLANAKAAFDNNPSTFWHTHPTSGQLAPPQSFTVDMGKQYTVEGFCYLPRQDGTFHGMTSRYKMEVSQDGKTFKTVSEGEFGNLRANPIEQSINFAPTKARYFRFTGTAALEKNHVSAAEISILGK